MQCRYLVIDIGNTNIEIGIYNSQELYCSWRLDSDASRTEDEYYALISSLASENQVDLKNIEICCISSVVPELSRIFEHLITKYLTSKIFNVNAYTVLGLTFPVTDPGFIGADLIVNAYSAWKKYNTNCIICDFGTATTIQLIGKDGYFHGTIISPGVVISSANLFQKASLLTKIQLETPQHTLGTNTRDALLSGIIKGHSLMVDAFIRRIKEDYRDLGEFRVILTGGIAHLIGDNLEEEATIDKTLTIDGLFRICMQHNTPVSS
ncbi:MAG: type III pantothenate kinase [Candidatus Cloacimonetes bacterium]|nr:type III pantothenate kinase [Candidatus Cloacimonadota bacterium]